MRIFFSVSANNDSTTEREWGKKKMKASQQVKMRNTLQGMMVLHSWGVRLIRMLLDELPAEKPVKAHARRRRVKKKQV
jgi:hypothetical protein